MPQIGGDIEQLQQLQSQFNAQIDAVATLRQAIDGQLGGTWWIGPAKDKFQAAWDGQYKQMLTNLQEALREAGVEVGQRANALHQAGS